MDEDTQQVTITRDDWNFVARSLKDYKLLSDDDFSYSQDSVLQRRGARDKPNRREALKQARQQAMREARALTFTILRRIHSAVCSSKPKPSRRLVRDHRTYIAQEVESVLHDNSHIHSEGHDLSEGLQVFDLATRVVHPMNRKRPLCGNVHLKKKKMKKKIYTNKTYISRIFESRFMDNAELEEALLLLRDILQELPIENEWLDRETAQRMFDHLVGGASVLWDRFAVNKENLREFTVDFVPYPTIQPGSDVTTFSNNTSQDGLWKSGISLLMVASMTVVSVFGFLSRHEENVFGDENGRYLRVEIAKSFRSEYLLLLQSYTSIVAFVICILGVCYKITQSQSLMPRCQFRSRPLVFLLYMTLMVTCAFLLSSFISLDSIIGGHDRSPILHGFGLVGPDVLFHANGNLKHPIADVNSYRNLDSANVNVTRGKDAVFSTFMAKDEGIHYSTLEPKNFAENLVQEANESNISTKVDTKEKLIDNAPTHSIDGKSLGKERLLRKGKTVAAKRAAPAKAKKDGVKRRRRLRRNKHNFRARNKFDL